MKFRRNESIYFDLNNKDYQVERWRKFCQSEVDQFENLVRSRGYDFNTDKGHTMGFERGTSKLE